MTIWQDIGGDHAFALYTDHDGAPIGALVAHPIHDDDEVCRWRGECMGAVLFRIPEAEPFVLVADGKRRPQWDVTALEPLHLEPSLLCHCGDHGFIRGGAWVAA